MSQFNTSKMAADLDARNLHVVGAKNGNGSDPVVCYLNTFKGIDYFSIRTAYEKNGKWNAGKGLSVGAANAKALLTELGRAAANY